MRVVKTAAATLTHTFYIDEAETDSSTTVTVAVLDANGTSVSSGNGTSAGVGTGRYTYTLPGQAALAELTASWSATIAGTAVVEQDRVDVVGARYFTLAQGRNSDDSLADEAKYTTEDLKTARDETEQEYEEITLRPFVRRYRRIVLAGSGTSDLQLPNQDVLTVRAASLAPRLDETFVALTGGQLAALAVLPDGILRRADGLAWTEGDGNVIVEYEHGDPGPPPADLIRAMLTRFRSRLNMNKTGIPDRAVSFSSADGGTYRLSTPGAWATGIPDVDAIYDRYSRRATNGGRTAKPASRTLDFTPQRYSLFHGGVR